ncbi:MAG: SDR family oxidoreductase [Paludibacter sp.]|nr:SDR family oxidoreductase [Paludibacter sp.]
MQKIVFITGASAGLGKATAKLFQGNGWKVIATMRNPENETELNQLQGVTLLKLDVTNPVEVRETVAHAIELGNIDVVVNNAAIGYAGPFETTSEEQLTQQIETNLMGAIRVTQAFISHFREKQSGIFINITSVAGLITFPFASLYHTAKAGLQAFSEGLSYELAPFGISVKTIAPGFIRTGFGNKMTVSPAGPYVHLVEKHMTAINSMMDPTTAGSTPEEVAALVYESVTDEKQQLLYVAGNDAQAMYNRYLELGTEASRKEMTTMFLGND